MIYKKSWKYILCKDTTPCCTEFGYFRPKSLKDFSDIKKGDFGGYLKCYHNLSQFGNCWVYDNAIIAENAQVSENAIVKEYAMLEYLEMLKFSAMQRS